MVLHSSLKKKLVYTVKVKGYKVKIYIILEDEFEQKFTFPRNSVLILVSVSKNWQTTSFGYVMPHEDYLVGNFFKPTTYGIKQWRKMHGTRKRI